MGGVGVKIKTEAMFIDLVGRNLYIPASGTGMMARFLNMNMARHDQIR